MSCCLILFLAVLIGVDSGLEVHNEHSTQELFGIIQKLNATIQANTAVQSNLPDIAFTARLSKDIELGQHQPIDFDIVTTNQGNAYNPRHGEFRAPVKGLYHFSARVMSLQGKILYCHMVKNGAPVAYLYAAAQDFISDSVEVYLVLNPGDMVWVRKDDTTTPYFIHYAYSTFSGRLIRQY